MSASAVTAALLEVVDLECIRGDRLLFGGLAFALGAGEIVQVEGANGAGKTSLLRILCGLARPTAGEVRWQGTDIRAQRAGYGRVVAYVGHAAGVTERLSGIENLRYAARMAGTGAEGTSAALERVGLADCGELPVRALSAGQRRRVALARLLLLPARLWLLDEPFTALDAGGRALVERLLSEHLRGGGLAVLTSHQPLSVEGSPLRSVNL